MGVRLTTPMTEVDNAIQEAVKRQREAMLYVLQYCGEECVNEARRMGSYTDRTGNLRSSVGYVIAIDGKVVRRSSFSVVKNGEAGAKEGLKFAKTIAGQYPKGVCLILVAGKNYASYVQHKGFNVTTSAELLAESLLPVMRHLINR